LKFPLKIRDIKGIEKNETILPHLDITKNKAGKTVAWGLNFNYYSIKSISEIFCLIENETNNYCRKQCGEEERLKGGERIEAEKRDEEARIRISGLEAVKAKYLKGDAA